MPSAWVAILIPFIERLDVDGPDAMTLVKEISNKMAADKSAGAAHYNFS